MSVFAIACGTWQPASLRLSQLVSQPQPAIASPRASSRLGHGCR